MSDAGLLQAIQIADLCSDIENCAKIARTSFAALRLIGNDGPTLEVVNDAVLARINGAGNLNGKHSPVALPPGPEQQRQATMQRLHQQGIAGLNTLFKRMAQLQAVASGQNQNEPPDGTNPNGIVEAG